MPSVEMVRFVSSGTEATMSAIRLARGFTGRDLIVKFAGCYHGHVDSLLVSAGSSALTHGVPNSPGVPKGCTDDTLVLQFNDCDGLARGFQGEGRQDRRRDPRTDRRQHGSGAADAGVPQGAPRSHPAARRTSDLRRGDDRLPARLRRCAGACSAIRPTSPAFGKIIGGGYPVGAYGGRAEIMQKIMPAGPVFQAGTLSGNPVAMAAGIATLKELKANPPYKRLDELGAKLEAGLVQAAARCGRCPSSSIASAACGRCSSPRRR